MRRDAADTAERVCRPCRSLREAADAGQGRGRVRIACLQYRRGRVLRLERRAALQCRRKPRGLRRDHAFQPCRRPCAVGADQSAQARARAVPRGSVMSALGWIVSLGSGASLAGYIALLVFAPQAALAIERIALDLLSRILSTRLGVGALAGAVGFVAGALYGDQSGAARVQAEWDAAE